MAFNKQTVKDIDVSGKRVLVRGDLDVPWDDEGNILDDYRIVHLLPTLKYLLDQNAAIVLIGHRGRPKEIEEKTSTRKIAELLQERLGVNVKFASDCGGEESQKMSKDLKPGEILVCENLRFYNEKTKPFDEDYAKQLAGLGDIFVQNAFANSHRGHVSMVGIPKHLPSVAGLLLAEEIEQTREAVENPEKPVLAITGGSKLETKLPLLENFMKLADNIVVAGVMANTLLVAKGHSVGKSVYDEDELEKAKEILELAEANNVEFVLPIKQVAVGASLDDENRVEKTLTEISDDDLILDFGQESINEVIGLIKQAKTIIWNGPLGYYENPVFAEGSNQVAKAIAETDARSVVGGGDTGDVVNSLGLADKFTHVSTGGGASLELLAGHKLPGIEALLDK